MQSQHSVGSSRVDPEAPRLLRLRAEPTLGEQILPARPGDGGGILIRMREAATVGDRMRIEVSLGAMADEVLLNGVVTELSPAPDAGFTVVTVRVSEPHADRLRYLADVLCGRREATARRSRRTPCDLPVTWEWTRGTHRTRLRDLSRGGAFILSDVQPRVGDPVRVVIEADDRGRLVFESEVSWSRDSGAHPGFGVSFKVPDRESAAALQALVRVSEDALAATLPS